MSAQPIDGAHALDLILMPEALGYEGAERQKAAARVELQALRERAALADEANSLFLHAWKNDHHDGAMAWCDGNRDVGRWLDHYAALKETT